MDEIDSFPTPSAPKSQEERDAADAAAFQRVSGVGAGEWQPTPWNGSTIAPAPSGDEQKIGRTEERGSRTPGATPGEPADAGPDMDDPKSRERFMVARQALLRDGVLTAAEIDAWPRERVLQAGEKRRRVQSEGDGLMNRLRDLESQIAKGGASADGKEPEPASNRSTGVGSEPAGADGLDDVLGSLEFDDPDAVATIRGRISEMQARTDAATTAAKAAINRFTTYRAQRTAEKVGSLFPEIRDEKELRSVLAVMDKLDPAGTALESDDESLMEQLMRDACFVRYGERVLNHARKADAIATHALLSGSPTTGFAGTGKPAGNGQRTRDEIDEAAYRAVSSSGGSSEAAFRFSRMIGKG